MPKLGQRYKKPTIKRFKEVVEACKGVKGEVAKALGVNRVSVNLWCKADPAFAACFEEFNGRFLDECLKSARLLAVGIPQIKKVNGKNIVTGWKERPDGQMLRYLIGKLGRDEGYAESIDITSKGESIKPDPVIVEVIDRREQVVKPEEQQ